MTASPARTARRVLPWAALSLALGVAAVVVVVVRFDALPDPYPTHFGPGGEPDAFGARTHAQVLAPVVIGQIGGLAIIVGSLLTPARIPGVGRALAALGLVIGGGTSLLSIGQNLDAAAVPPPWGVWVFLGATLAVVAWLVAESVRVGPAEDADWEREHWKWGFLYLNPDEPDVFVPKRVGVGVTLNLARPMAWLLLALILAPGVIIISMVMVAT